jgi:hypothetical protein
VQFSVPASAFEEEDGAAGEGVTRLYGEWQTVAWAPPAARDGVVPKNERGNVNVPPFAQALPAGATLACCVTTLRRRAAEPQELWA